MCKCKINIEMKITCLWLQNSTEMHIAYISSSNQKLLTHTGSSMKSVQSCDRMRQYYNPNFLPYWFLRIQILFYITHRCHRCMHDIFLPKFKVLKSMVQEKVDFTELWLHTRVCLIMRNFCSKYFPPVTMTIYGFILHQSK